MVELGNHQGRPPGGQQPLSDMGSDLSCVSLSSSMLDHWINQDIACLDFLDGLDPTSDSHTACAPVCPEPTPITTKETAPLGMAEEYQQAPILPLWGFPMDIDSLKLDEVFQVDQSDLVQSPTLAELNADKEPFFDLEFGDLDIDFVAVPIDIKKEDTCTDKAAAVTVRPKTPTIKVDSVVTIKKEPVDEMERNASPDFVSEEEKACVVPRESRASSSPLAIPGVSARCRQRTYSVTELSVTSSVSSNDEGFGSQAEDTDIEAQPSDAESAACDDESPEGSPCSAGGAESNSFSVSAGVKSSKPSSRKKRYFWQYNIQSKGPKGPRMPMNSALNADPHILNDITDPVFSAECHLEGVKHAGKARRGDGNDLTANPRKLHNIGVELKSLNRLINELSSACDTPGGAKPKSRKEKNKLASRSCRLKKKAQHEANKLKLFGLQQEHTHLMNLMGDIKTLILEGNRKNMTLRSCRSNLLRLLDKKSTRPVAGHTAEYVNSVLDKVASGHPLPGLDDGHN